jgi:hypothetical protein
MTESGDLGKAGQRQQHAERREPNYIGTRDLAAAATDKEMLSSSTTATGDETATRSSESSSISIGRASQDSGGDDGLEPLEHRISPALQEVIQIRTTTSVGSSASRPPDFEIDFGDDDDPRSWPVWYRAWTLFCISFSTWMIVLYSTTYTASIPGLMKAFEVESQTVATLGVTTYLLGLGFGTLIFAPISELYGRKPVYIVCMLIFTLLIIPACLATSLAEILVVRFFGYGKVHSSRYL